jgi:hypothetical protein
MKGMVPHNTFTPSGCNATLDTTAVTVSAGQAMIEIYAYTDTLNQTVVGGESETVGIGGYITGTGHSALSIAYGLAADNVMEVSLVSPSGEILTANACQNTDLFFAFRGGGGGTFGVLLNVTMRTYPTMPTTIMNLEIVAEVGSEDFWDMNAYFMSQYPYLADQQISGYPTISPVYQVSENESVALLVAGWHDYRSAYNNSNITAIFDPILSYIASTWPDMEISNPTTAYASRYQAALGSHDTSNAGADLVLGSRLLDAGSLTGNQTALKEAIKGFTGTGANDGSSPFLLGGRGVWNAEPLGGGDAVCPAWRTSLVHFGKCLFLEVSM